MKHIDSAVFVATAGLCALLLGACGSSPGAAGPADPNAYQSAFSTEGCALAVKCGILASSELPACAMSGAAPSQAYSLEAAVSAGRLKYDSGAAQRCLNDLDALDCTLMYRIYVFGGEELLFPNDCGKIFAGQVATGKTCESDLECADGYCAGTVTPGCPGMCQPSLAAGQACNQAKECGPTMECNDGVSGGACQVPASAGAACGGSNPGCQAGLNCVFDAIAVNGVGTKVPTGACHPPGTMGAQCVTTVDKDAVGLDSCGPGFACQPAMSLVDSSGAGYYNVAVGTCQPRLASGASCMAADGCADGLVCKGWKATKGSGGSVSIVAGTCTSWEDMGGACLFVSATASIQNMSMSGCTADSLCDMTTQKCLVPGPAGTACDPTGRSGAGCGSGTYCADDDKCTPGVPYGGACALTMAGFDPCADGSCDSTGHCSLVCM